MASTTTSPVAIPKLHRPLRWFGAIVLLGAVAAGSYWNDAYRSFEAALAAVALSPFVQTSGSSGDTYFIQQPHGMLGLEITPECTALILLVPLAIIAAIMLVVTRAPYWRIAAGVGAMYGIVTIVNEIRLAFIGFATNEWGVDLGYPLSHTYLGSVIGILGFVAGLIVLLVVAGARPKLRRR